MNLHPDLYRCLVQEATALASYLIQYEIDPTCEAYDPIDRAVDHVAALNGYTDEDAVHVASIIWPEVAKRCGVQLVSPASINAPEFTP